MRSVIDEIKRRKVGQWSTGYIAAAFVVVQLLDALDQPLGMSVAVQRSILWLVAVGFLFTVVLAWFHGDQGRQSVGGGEFTVLLALVAVAGFGMALIGSAGTSSPSGRRTEQDEEGRAVPTSTIAVLPLRNLSPDPANDYLADGLTAALQGRLSTTGLSVAAIQSTLGYRETTKSAEEIGAELGVRYLVGGGVFTDGENLRITVQLSDAQSGFDVQSLEFTGRKDEIFELQENAAIEIARKLGIELTARQTAAVRARYTNNVEAYDSYLRGRRILEAFHTLSNQPEVRLEEARNAFERAIELDPRYAVAIAGLSEVDSYYVLKGFDTSDARKTRARELADQALAIDSLLPEAYAARADADGAARNFARAISGYQEAVRRDRDNGIAWCHYAYACNATGDAEAAERAAREAVRLYPTYAYAYEQLGTALRNQDKDAEAIEAFEQQIEWDPRALSPFVNIAEIHMRNGDHREALAAYQGAAERQETPTLLHDIARAHAALGDDDAALSYLQTALERGYRSLSSIDSDDSFSALRADGRLEALLGRYR